MPRRKRREEHENLERWLISYADFITLLFAFFVVMYSVSSVNEGKYRVLSDTLVTAFDPKPVGRPLQTTDSGSKGSPNVIRSQSVQQGPPSVIQQLQETAQSSALVQLATDFRQATMPLIEDDLINVTQNELWVEIEINSEILYRSGSAELQDEARPILARLAKILTKYPNFIQVEGFTDNLPINTYLYPSNWELSAARAASVVHLFMEEGVEPDRMSAIGYGEYRPVASNATAEGRAKNRRVAIVVLADDRARRALDVQRNRATSGGARDAAPPGGGQ